MTPATPDQLFGALFRDVQLGQVFPDSKTFVDCVPKMAPEAILKQYEVQQHQPHFNLKLFVDQHFIVPEASSSTYVSDTSVSTAQHIENLWPRLTRSADDQPVEGSSRLPLPYSYVVPGGRFREIFYWDTYFTMLGLKRSWKLDLLRNQLNNFAYLIDTYGLIPNGNRTYFLSRSQPPCFALMVRLLENLDGPDVLLRYLPQLRREYDFWMTGHDQLTETDARHRRVVRLPNGAVLNRYWDPERTPRPEAFRKEYALAQEAAEQGIDVEALHLHLRAACESGWDFSSRWLGDDQTMTSIRASDILPVDLNSLLHYLERTLHEAYRHAGDVKESRRFEQMAETRKQAIQATFWNEDRGFFMDYDLVTGRHTTALTLASAFPLFLELATPEQARRIHDRLKEEFLCPGGWVTTLVQTGQQWDSPNGWAPLQWIVYRGLTRYGFTETAHEGRRRWLDLNDKVFRATGKMMEKYNVVDAALTTGGGEYPNQDGFGWTNGVYLQLLLE